MLTQILWWACNTLIGLLLLRAVRGRFFSKYPVFYFYLTFVLIVALLRFCVYTFNPSAYQTFYWWYTQFPSIAVGYCVIWQIYTQALADYAGAARMARRVLLAAFVVVVGKVLANALSGPIEGPAKTAADLERNLRTVQALLLVAILGVLVYYAIPIGRNLKGIILGYGFFIGTSVINLTLRSHIGENFQVWWQYLHQSAYLVTLFIWSASLWSYQPNPKAEREIALERDYELLSGQTARAMAKARSYIVRGVRP